MRQSGCVAWPARKPGHRRGALARRAARCAAARRRRRACGRGRARLRRRAVLRGRARRPPRAARRRRRAGRSRASAALSFIARGGDLGELLRQRAPPLHRVDDAGTALPAGGRGGRPGGRRRGLAAGAAGRPRVAAPAARAACAGVGSSAIRAGRPSAGSSSAASTASCAAPPAPGSWRPACARSVRARTARCAVRSMRLSSSSGSSVGAIHWPMPGIAAPAFLTRPWRKSKPGTIWARRLGAHVASPWFAYSAGAGRWTAIVRRAAAQPRGPARQRPCRSMRSTPSACCQRSRPSTSMPSSGAASPGSATMRSRSALTPPCSCRSARRRRCR